MSRHCHYHRRRFHRPISHGNRLNCEGVLLEKGVLAVLLQLCSLRSVLSLAGKAEVQKNFYAAHSCSPMRTVTFALYPKGHPVLYLTVERIEDWRSLTLDYSASEKRRRLLQWPAATDEMVDARLSLTAAWEKLQS